MKKKKQIYCKPQEENTILVIAIEWSSDTLTNNGASAATLFSPFQISFLQFNLK